MNLYVTSKCPKECALKLDDKTIDTNITEVSIMLSCAIRCNGYIGEDVYECIDINHPVNKWVRKNSGNYMWTIHYFKALCFEYSRRTKLIHPEAYMSKIYIDNLHLLTPGKKTIFENHALYKEFNYTCMSDVYKAYYEVLTQMWLDSNPKAKWYGVV